MVDPPSSVPYAIFSWEDNSATFCMGFCNLSTVRSAVKLAVYDGIIMIVKNHQIPPRILAEVAYIVKNRNHNYLSLKKS